MLNLTNEEFAKTKDRVFYQMHLKMSPAKWWPFCSVINVLTHWGRDEINNIFADNIFKRIFFNENVWISIKISLKFVPKGPIYNIPALVQIIAWCHSGDKPLSEPMMVSLPMHICVTRPQWVGLAFQELVTCIYQNQIWSSPHLQ